MLGGQVAVFVSCSEKFKEAVARPVRDTLAEHGLRGIIVSDEPPLPGTGEHAGAGGGEAGGHSLAKVESYLDASSASWPCAPRITRSATARRTRGPASSTRFSWRAFARTCGTT